MTRSLLVLPARLVKWAKAGKAATPLWTNCSQNCRPRTVAGDLLRSETRKHRVCGSTCLPTYRPTWLMYQLSWNLVLLSSSAWQVQFAVPAGPPHTELRSDHSAGTACSSFSTSQSEQRSGIEPLMGSESVVSTTVFMLAAIGLSAP